MKSHVGITIYFVSGKYGDISVSCKCSDIFVSCKCVDNICIYFPCFFNRKAVKAAIVLLPLLGITYAMFILRPEENTTFGLVLIYTDTVLQSFQVGLLSSFHLFLASVN